jgi:hypothetical protein
MLAADTPLTPLRRSWAGATCLQGTLVHDLVPFSIGSSQPVSGFSDRFLQAFLLVKIHGAKARTAASVPDTLPGPRDASFARRAFGLRQ